MLFSSKFRWFSIFTDRRILPEIFLQSNWDCSWDDFCAFLFTFFPVFSIRQMTCLLGPYLHNVNTFSNIFFVQKFFWMNKSILNFHILSWYIKITDCRSRKWCDDLWRFVFNFNRCWSYYDTEFLSCGLLLFGTHHSTVLQLLLRKPGFCCGMRKTLKKRIFIFI